MPDYLWARDESPRRRALLAPMILLEGPYRLLTAMHRCWYSWCPSARVRLPVQVVSIGNLTVGGSAKTPLTAWLARELQSRGRRVAVLSRGVGGQRIGEVNVVSDGEKVLSSPLEVGDEPVLLARELPGVPVLAGRNRVALGYRAASMFGAELLLLDDGFQHHRLARDLDLVCLDGQTGIGNGHVLPRGPLREAKSALRYADALVYTRVVSDSLPDPPPGASAPRFAVSLAPRELRALDGSSARPVDALDGARVGLLTAIARPDRLARQLAELGAQLVERRVFADHHMYRPDDVVALDPSLCWLTTAKDAVKLPSKWFTEQMPFVLEESVIACQPRNLADFVCERLDRTAR